jgi:hypothetical protein
MKKAFLISLAIVFGVLFVCTMQAAAWGECGCDHGCQPSVYCSPGFYKNHTEVWYGRCCSGPDCDEILADLKERGPGSGYIRAAAAAYLNECFEREGFQPCEDD